MDLVIDMVQDGIKLLFDPKLQRLKVSLALGVCHFCVVLTPLTLQCPLLSIR